MTSSNFRDLSPLLNPKNIAVLGASERPGSAGRLVLENLKQLDFPGKVYALNPKHKEIMGFPCYPSLEALPEAVDMVAILRSADTVLPTLKTMKKMGIPAAWALASGFSEAGPEGKQRQAEISAYARDNNLLLCGPNCVGVANLLDRSATYSVAIKPAIKTGVVSAIMQSGAILMGLANSARFGFRYLISSGNEAVLDAADYIGYLAEDEKTKIIIVFLESIRNADKFIQASRAAYQAGKPILVVKVGRSEAAQRSVQAHTGSLAGSDDVLDQVFKREGIVRLDSLDELLEAAELFLNCPLPKSDGVGLLSLSGGQIGLISDLAQGIELNLPEFDENTQTELRDILPPFTGITNPLDAWGTGDMEKMYPGCVAAVARDPNIGLIAMTRDTPPGVAQREITQTMQMAEAAIRSKNETGKPILMFSNLAAGFDPETEQRLRDENIAYLQGTQEALKAIEAFVKYANFKRENQGILAECKTTEPSDKTLHWREYFSNQKGSLTEIEGRKLLIDYGIQGPKEAVAADEASAVEAAHEIGFPVVLKILSPDIQHKTEFGGVRVGLEDAEAVSKAFQEVMQAAHEHKPDARLEGVIIQEMIPSNATEVILGIIKDAAFGPVIVFGSGGILVELVKDSALRLPPLTAEETLAMIHETKGINLLKGYRGSPAADMNALVDAIVKLSQLAVDLGDQIAALEINPLMVLPDGEGVRAVDAVIELVNR
ncbi:MAG: acetate--CoA ligase family protein [Anaerolineaceae bacterium]|nr:acetate--CoA ligase family protein [Anaerolineaceae bacterium]